MSLGRHYYGEKDDSESDMQIRAMQRSPSPGIGSAVKRTRRSAVTPRRAGCLARVLVFSGPIWLWK
ncbi:hypothetical protein EYF80_050090 [Liparis tanakae]|uniref:Uncharacterized protein n=1 Tax=Liparis tanakae TaxID=230148 RepID=A0A4Z2FFM1_9TELE|nr:hypothetical protein EYF80_050090 [Liparis tanakae]